MIDFFSDLDNTFVYSHRVSLPGQRVAVEYLNNCVQSYMTQKSFNFLTTQDKIRLIPVTTRTCEQYARLSETFMGFGCQYALVCNGGILLHNNKVDPRWIAETRLIAEDGVSWLLEAEKFIRLELSVQNIHEAEGIMIYARVDAPPACRLPIIPGFQGIKANYLF